MEHTRIPQEELELLKQLKNIKVIFDVGARADIDYLQMFPKAKHHLFEINPSFFNELKEKVGTRKNVFLNNYGLGDIEGEFAYNEGLQAVSGGEAWKGDGRLLPIKTLDWYIKKNKIKRIDFMKLDIEGYEYKALLGGKTAIKLSKYLQYEHWNEMGQFHELLSKDFDLEYIGYRNVLCINKNLVKTKDKEKVAKYIKDHNLAVLA